MREVKNSGIEWVGMVPSSWKTKLGKHFMSCLSRPVLETDGVITCFRDGEVTLRSKRREDGFTVSFQEIGYQGIEDGDLVVHGMDGFAGAIGISDSRGKATPVLNVLDTKQHKPYLMFAMRNMAYTDVFLALSTGIRVRSCDTSWKKLRSLPYVLPPIEEQKAIANIITEKCKQVESLIANQEKQIEKLKAYKQSLITEAVTKGLNHNVPMKDSNIDWIGKIPEHWNIVRLKHLYDYTNGSPVRVGPFGSALPSSEIIDDGIWVYNQRSVLDNNFETNNTFVSEQKAEELVGFSVFPGDILITTRGSIGKTAIVPNNAPKGILHPCVIRFRICESKVNKELLSTIFNETQICLGQILDMSNSTTIEVLYSYSLKEIWIPVPPQKEQQEIMKRVSCIIEKFEHLISIKKQKIAMLEEYKKSIIYEYVTGKKEVI